MYLLPLNCKLKNGKYGELYMYIFPQLKKTGAGIEEKQT